MIPDHIRQDLTQGMAFGEDALLLKATPGKWTGRFVPGPFMAPEPIRLASRPLGGEVMDTLPEGVRVEDYRLFWVDIDIPVRVTQGGVDAPRLADRIVWKWGATEVDLLAMSESERSMHTFRVIRVERQLWRQRVLGVFGDTHGSVSPTEEPGAGL